MITKLFRLALVTLSLSIPVHSETAKKAAVIELRAMLHDPAHPVADIYLPDKSGSVVKLDLMTGGLSTPHITPLVNGSVLFYTTAEVDAEKPLENLASSVKVPENVNRAIVILIPGAAGSKQPYSAVLIDDSSKGFPSGESRILSLVPVETAIEAGEHKLPILSGKITHVPIVKNLNEFNMAQTNFYYKDGDSWVTFTERQVQYLKDFRRIFIISATPGATQPFVTTVVDTTPIEMPDRP